MKHLHAYHRDHFLTRLDARVKLLSALALLGLVLTGNVLLFPLVVAVICLGFTLHAGTPGRVLLVGWPSALYCRDGAAPKAIFAVTTRSSSNFSVGLTIGVYADGLERACRSPHGLRLRNGRHADGGGPPFCELMGASPGSAFPVG